MAIRESHCHTDATAECVILTLPFKRSTHEACENSVTGGAVSVGCRSRAKLADVSLRRRPERAPRRGRAYRFAAATRRNRFDPQAAPSPPYDAPFAASDPVLASLIRFAWRLPRLNGATHRGSLQRFRILLYLAQPTWDVRQSGGCKKLDWNELGVTAVGGALAGQLGIGSSRRCSVAPRVPLA